MKFVEPKYTDLYNKLYNNNRLRNFLLKNKALVKADDFYDNYGLNNKEYMKTYIETNNNQVYKNLTELLLPEISYIEENTIEYLVASGYNKEEIKYACGFSTDVILNYDFYWEIFFTCKYCYTESFFQNNWEYFLPECDFEGMSTNDSAVAFMDAIMKEFDHLDYILKTTKKFKSYKDIPFEYINYLSQLLGVEQKTFMIGSDMAAQYRVLAENIIDVYKERGTSASWELMFNFLGFNVNVEEYYFDRRRYFTTNGMNTEMNSANVKDYKYYLTTIDPRTNLKEELATNETVTDSDFSEIKNLRNFNQLVEEFGLMCVLGYDDLYMHTKTKIDEQTDLEIKGASELCEYKKDVYKYFKTNYLRIKPTLKFESGNFTMDQLYQLTCLLNFLTPEFVQREMYTIIDTGETDEKLIINYSRDKSSDDFYILDSEDWDQSYSEKYLKNFESYKNNATQSYSSDPKVINDLGEERVYVNSLGQSSHFANGKFYNVFFNPLSEKIKIINSTKYWGDKIKVEDATGKIYPVWRTDMNYQFGGITHQIDSNIKDLNGNKLQEIYLPQHVSLLPNKWVEKNWSSIDVVDLNGFENKSIRRFIKNMKNFIEIKWKTDLPINIFIKEKLSNDDLKKYTISEEDKKTREKFFEKGWREVSNLTWERFGPPLNKNNLVAFINNHSNIINYDYIKKELFCDNDFTNLSFSDDASRYKISSYASSSQSRKQTNNQIAEELLLALDGDDCYYIASNASLTEFYTYKTAFKSKFRNYTMYKFRPEPDYRITSAEFVYPTYISLLNSFNEDGDTFIYDKTGESINITSSTSAVFYVSTDKEYYKPMFDMTGLKIIIHSQGLSSEPPSVYLATQKASKIKKQNILGSFVYENAYLKDELTKPEYDEEDTNRKLSSEEQYKKLKEMRHPKLKQYKYLNIYKNDLIYSTYDQKLYVITANGVFTLDKDVKNISIEKINSNAKNQIVNSDNNIFGINEVNFYGKLKLCDDNVYRIYEYDSDYKGFSEQDDDENYILNNYERVVEWENLGIQSSVIKRPIKEKTDRQFDKLNDNNEIANNILKEIFNSMEDKFNRSDLISWKIEKE